MERLVRGPDAVLIATPESKCSVQGVRKNSIDRAARPCGEGPCSEEPVAIVNAPIGTLGTVLARYHLRQRFIFLNRFSVSQPEM